MEYVIPAYEQTLILSYTEKKRERPRSYRRYDEYEEDDSDREGYEELKANAYVDPDYARELRKSEEESIECSMRTSDDGHISMKVKRKRQRNPTFVK